MDEDAEVQRLDSFVVSNRFLLSLHLASTLKAKTKTKYNSFGQNRDLLEGLMGMFHGT